MTCIFLAYYEQRTPPSNQKIKNLSIYICRTTTSLFRPIIPVLAMPLIEFGVLGLDHVGSLSLC